MIKAENERCPLCGKAFGKEECMDIPMNFTGLWQLFKTHKKCEEKHQKRYGKKMKERKHTYCHYKHKGRKCTRFAESDFNGKPYCNSHLQQLLHEQYDGIDFQKAEDFKK